MQIIPSILTQSEKEFEMQIYNVIGNLEMVQIDVADGKFVPNTTWAEPETIKKITKELKIELHLMVEHPIEEIPKWTHLPNLKRILFHYESSDDIQKVIDLIKNNNLEASLVLNPDTKIEKIIPYTDKLDGVMFMGVKPGFQSQKFIPETIERIKTIKQMKPKLFLELDGGVNEDTLPLIIKSGVNAVCPGSAIFKNERSPKENIQRLKKQLKNN